ncbi:hypothetical protein ACFSS8_09590 [Paracoccus kondratievae]
MPRAALAQAMGLSAQAVSNITRELIAAGLLDAGGERRRGKVGQPLLPLALAPEGRCFWVSRSGAGWPSWCWSILQGRSDRCGCCLMPFPILTRSATLPSPARARFLPG